MNAENFKTVTDKSLPLKDVLGIKSYSYDSCNFYLLKNELEHFQEIMTKKGNCSTDDAATRIAYGNVFDSHAIAFYLYNFAALKTINTFIPKKHECSLLELGCNNGHVSRLLQRNGFRFKEYWGVDFDFSFIVDGLKSFTDQDNMFKSNFCSGDFNKPLNFKDDYFDIVFFQEAFDHCKDRFFYAEQCLSEIRRVLKPNAFFYITLVFENEHRDLYHWDHNYIWKKNDFENIIKDYFEIVNFMPLLTFEHTLQTSKDKNVIKVLNNWPTKIAKQFCAPFVDENETAVGAYFLRKHSI